MTIWYSWTIAILTLLASIFALNIMIFWQRNHFNVDGKTVLITGGSQGMGRSVGRILAEKGANVTVVARTESKLKEACDYISEGAKGPQQRFSYIKADLTSASECIRVVEESVRLNNGMPVDVVWCCAGSSHPTIFVDTAPDVLSSQMTNNYLSAAWTAQAALKSWLQTKPSITKDAKPTYHLIFTASFLALYNVAGYGPYSPTKAALRSLSDTLSQEVLLYKSIANFHVHTIFPATIYTESYEAENKVKSDLTKMLEEDDEGQTPDACARAAITGLEGGDEMVTTAFLTRLVMCATLGGSKRSYGISGFLDGLLAFLMTMILPWIRWLMDRKVVSWGTRYGSSGMKDRKM